MPTPRWLTQRRAEHLPRAGISKTFRESEPPCDPSADAGPSRTLPTPTARLTPREGPNRSDRRSARSLAWFRNGSFWVTLGSFSAGRSRCAGVTDPGYNLAVLLRFEAGSFSQERANRSSMARHGTVRSCEPSARNERGKSSLGSSPIEHRQQDPGGDRRGKNSEQNQAEVAPGECQVRYLEPHGQFSRRLRLRAGRVVG